MIGVWIIVALAVIASALAVWRITLVRYDSKRPQPRHTRARGIPCAFIRKGGDDT